MATLPSNPDDDALLRDVDVARYLTVPEAAADVGVCDDKVRTWCRNGAIRDVLDIGDKCNRFYRIPADAWEEFKRQRKLRRPIPPTVSRLRPRAGTNHLGL